MKRDHEIMLPLVNPDKHKGTHVEINVSYEKGEWEPLGGTKKQRGYYLGVGIIGIEEREHCTARSYNLTIPRFVDQLETTTRFNQKRIDALFAQVQADVAAKRGKVWELVERILARQKRELLANPVAVERS